MDALLSSEAIKACIKKPSLMPASTARIRATTAFLGNREPTSEPQIASALTTVLVSGSGGTCDR